MTLHRSVVLMVLPLMACSSGNGSGGGEGPPTAKAPARAGEVWAIGRPDDRATGPGALLAYLHGLHVAVLDGDQAYAGMTRLEGERAADGARVFPLGDGLTATLVPAGDDITMRFSTGDSVLMRKQVAP